MLICDIFYFEELNFLIFCIREPCGEDIAETDSEDSDYIDFSDEDEYESDFIDDDDDVDMYDDDGDMYARSRPHKSGGNQNERGIFIVACFGCCFLLCACLGFLGCQQRKVAVFLFAKSKVFSSNIFIQDY